MKVHVSGIFIWLEICLGFVGIYIYIYTHIHTYQKNYKKIKNKKKDTSIFLHDIPVQKIGIMLLYDYWLRVKPAQLTNCSSAAKFFKPSGISLPSLSRNS